MTALSRTLRDIALRLCTFIRPDVVHSFVLQGDLCWATPHGVGNLKVELARYPIDVAVPGGEVSHVSATSAGREGRRQDAQTAQRGGERPRRLVCATRRSCALCHVGWRRSPELDHLVLGVRCRGFSHLRHALMRGWMRGGPRQRPLPLPCVLPPCVACEGAVQAALELLTLLL